MAEVTKLDAAFARFEKALNLFEAATAAHVEERNRLRATSAGAEVAARDHARLQSQLAEVRQKATELVDTSKQAAGKIDTAMGRIRSVLHTNSGA